MSSIHPTGEKKKLFFIALFCMVCFLKVHFKPNYKRIQFLWIQYVDKIEEVLKLEAPLLRLKENWVLLPEYSHDE